VPISLVLRVRFAVVAVVILQRFNGRPCVCVCVCVWTEVTGWVGSRRYVCVFVCARVKGLVTKSEIKTKTEDKKKKKQTLLTTPCCCCVVQIVCVWLCVCACGQRDASLLCACSVHRAAGLKNERTFWNYIYRR